MAKKKLLTVKPLAYDNENRYDIENMHFTLVSSPDEGRRQVFKITSCREFLCRSVWAKLTNFKTTHTDNTPSENKIPVDFEKLRLLFAYRPGKPIDGSYKERLFKGKVALNVIEKMAGWDTSVITSVHFIENTSAWLLTGPKEWMSCPQLLSLVTWILRLSIFTNALDVTNFTNLEKSIKGLPLVNDWTEYPGTLKNDFEYSPEKLWDKLYILTYFHKEIFGDMDINTAWANKLSTPIDFTTNCGVESFVEGRSVYNKDTIAAYKKFKHLYIKHLSQKESI